MCPRVPSSSPPIHPPCSLPFYLLPCLSLPSTLTSSLLSLFLFCTPLSFAQILKEFYYSRLLLWRGILLTTTPRQNEDKREDEYLLDWRWWVDGALDDTKKKHIMK